MTQEEFKAKLDSTGLPTFYNLAPDGTKVPFLTYTWHRVPMLLADDSVYAKKVEISVDLVCNSKEMLNRCGDALESVLDEISPWTSNEGWDDQEKIYLNTYSLEV